MFEQLLREWEGEHVVVRHDAESGAWMFVCVHSSRLPHVSPLALPPSPVRRRRS